MKGWLSIRGYLWLKYFISVALPGEQKRVFYFKHSLVQTVLLFACFFFISQLQRQLNLDLAYTKWSCSHLQNVNDLVSAVRLLHQKVKGSKWNKQHVKLLFCIEVSVDIENLPLHATEEWRSGTRNYCIKIKQRQVVSVILSLHCTVHNNANLQLSLIKPSARLHATVGLSIAAIIHSSRNWCPITSLPSTSEKNLATANFVRGVFERCPLAKGNARITRNKVKLVRQMRPWKASMKFFEKVIWIFNIPCNLAKK